MRKATLNTFHEGINFDLDPISAPNNVLTDCLNGTLITFNGNEYVLQNDFGNAKVETTKLKPGFIPIGITSYGGIIYVVSHNPMTNESEFGSFPSPERNIDPDNYETTDPASGITGLNEKVIADESFYENGNLIQLVRRDLMSLDNFELSAGDKYAVYITDANQAQNLINNIDKIFDLKLANVNDGGLTYIDDYTIYTKAEVSFDETVSGLPIKYDVYTGSDKAKLAIIAKLKTIDYFTLNVTESTDNLNPEVKRVLIHATSGTSCDIKCKGFLLNVYKQDVEAPVYTKYVYSETGDLTNCSFQLKGFEENIEYTFEAIPYTQYQIYSSDEFSRFKKKVSITIGKDSSGIPVGQTYYNDTFKYYVDDSYIVIDFNLKKRTNGSIYKAYIEFYDPWSDVSTIQEVANYDLLGTNTVRLDVVNEPVADDFQGGISLSKIGSWATTDHVEVILSKSGRYRKDESIRINHFYYVRICLVELNDSTFSYHDLYKTMITDKKFNDYYSNNDILDYYPLSRELDDITYSKSELNEVSGTSTINEYLGDFTTVNTNKLFYSISNGVSDPSEKYFGYETKRTDLYKSTINYTANLNNDIIGKLNSDVISVSSIGVDQSNLSTVFTPSVNGDPLSLNTAFVNSHRVNSFVLDPDNNFVFDVNDKLFPNLTIYTKAQASRVSYGNGTKQVKTKNGFTKYYLKDKFISHLNSSKASIEMSGENQFLGTGIYSNVASITIGKNALMYYCPNGIEASQHSDNFNIRPSYNNEYTKISVYTAGERCDGTDWFIFLNQTAPAHNLCYLVKQINFKNSNRDKSYAWENNEQAVVDFVNTQKYVLVMPSLEGSAVPNSYVIIPIKGNSLEDIINKINKFGSNMYYAEAQSSDYNTYFISGGSYSYDLDYKTSFKFSNYGISYSTNNNPAFKFRFFNMISGEYDEVLFDESNILSWLSSNAVSSGRTIINPGFSGIFKTPAFANKTTNLISSGLSFEMMPSIPETVLNKFVSSNEDMLNDLIWIDDPNTKANEINTSAKQYENLIQYFGFDVATRAFFYKGEVYGGTQWGSKYSNSNGRRTIDVASSLLNSNFEL